MRVELLGHGLNNKLHTVEFYLKESLKDDNFNSFIGFSAYTTKAGFNLIESELKEATIKYKNIVFYLGMAEKGTSKQALEFLLEQNIETYTFCSYSSYIFHPKIFFFEGNTEKRMIIGSSNLTKSGLNINGNIEASILIDYSKSDSSGMKLQKQYFEYFEEILNGSNSLVKKLTDDLLEKYCQEGIVVDEEFTLENQGSPKSKPKNNVKRKKLKEKESKKKNDNNGDGDGNTNISITKKYLDTWDNFFSHFLEFKNETGNVTIPRDHPNPAFYRWYRLQKIYYADDLIDTEYVLKYEHIDKLEKAGFFFGDAHELLQQNIEDEWLSILEELINDPNEKDKIRVDHRYKPNGHRLGTWLVGVSQENRKENPRPRKIELKTKIEELGFDFTKTSRKPEHTSQRFLNDLTNDKSPIKVDYQKRFNRQILPRVDKIPLEIREEIDVIWELQFNEKRTWEKIKKAKDRTPEWKEFRYNGEINPERKWITGQSAMGDLYNWVYHKRRDKKKMDLVIHHFNDSEKMELKNEGFPIE
jgi:HKD family nuclease